MWILVCHLVSDLPCVSLICQNLPLDPDQQFHPKSDLLPWRLSHQWQAKHGDVSESRRRFPWRLPQSWHPSGAWQAGGPQHHTHLSLDSVSQEIRLPADKLHSLLDQLHHWPHARKTTKRKLLSLIGSLSFAAKASGLFLRRLISDLSTKVHKLHHHIRLNAEALAEFEWWKTFLPTWNGDPSSSILRLQRQRTCSCIPMPLES